METLETMLKRAFHRKLLPEQLRMAREGKETESKQSLLGQRRKATTYLIVNGEPVVRVVRMSERVTRNASEPSRLHLGYYTDDITYYRYTQEGDLKEKYVETGCIFDEAPIRVSVVQFNPPGRWTGNSVEGTDFPYRSIRIID